MHLCASVLHMCRWLQKEKRAFNALELESESIVSCLSGCWKPLRKVFSAPASTEWEPFLLLQSGFWSALTLHSFSQPSLHPMSFGAPLGSESQVLLNTNGSTMHTFLPLCCFGHLINSYYDLYQNVCNLLIPRVKGNPSTWQTLS